MKNANTTPRWSVMRLALSWKTFDFYERASIYGFTKHKYKSLNWPAFCHIWPSNGVVPVVTEVVLKLYVNQWKCLHFRDKTAPVLVSTADSRRKPIDTPLRGNVPRCCRGIGSGRGSWHRSCLPKIGWIVVYWKQKQEMQTMIKIYGMPTCPYCDYVGHCDHAVLCTWFL